MKEEERTVIDWIFLMTYRNRVFILLPALSCLSDIENHPPLHTLQVKKKNV